MNKERLLALCFLIIAIVLFVICGYTGNILYFFLIPAIGIIVTLIILLLNFRKIIKNDPTKENNALMEKLNQISDEEKNINLLMIKATRDNYRIASKSDKIKSIIFLVVFSIAIIGFIISMLFEKIYIGIGFWCGCVAFIIIMLIITKVKERRSLKLKKNYHYIRKYGKVIGAALSSATSTGGRRNSVVTSTIYKIILEVSNKRYTTYSRDSYNNDDIVEVLLDPNNDSFCYIEKLADKDFVILDSEF